MAWDKIIDRKLNQEYRGPAEKCTYTFSLWPDQIPGTGWVAQQIINAHSKELEEQGSALLELKVWEDTEPFWTTDYRVEVIASASPLWWNIIIAGALILLIGLIIYFIIEKVEDIFEYIGDNAPGAIPWMIVAGVGIVALIGIGLWKRKTANPRRMIGRRK